MLLITLGQKVKKSHNICLALRLGYHTLYLRNKGAHTVTTLLFIEANCYFLPMWLAPYEIGKGNNPLAPGYGVTTSYKVQGEGPAQIVCKIYWAC